MRSAVVVVDLGYGDSGKGSVTDALARRSSRPVTVIRFNGGPQAAHTVVTPQGRQHTFAQFGAGTLAGASTHLSEYMLVNPLNLLAEYAHLAEIGEAGAMHLLTISPEAKVITPWHKAVNRARERALGTKRHGSCAQGVGELMRLHEAEPETTLRAGTLTRDKAMLIVDALYETYVSLGRDAQEAKFFTPPFMRNQMNDFLAASDDVFEGGLFDDDQVLSRAHDFIFEGAQGVLLDEWYGFHPYTTWSTTTFDNALDLLCGHRDIEVTKLGLIRALPTRHGPGPFPTEDAELAMLEKHNEHNAWQGAWRTGWPDAMTLRYAVEVCGGIDMLGVTCVDHLESEVKIATSYKTKTIKPLFGDSILPGRRDLEHQEMLTNALFNVEPEYQTLESAQLPSTLASYCNAKLGLLSHGPTAGDKEWFTRDRTRQTTTDTRHRG